MILKKHPSAWHRFCRSAVLLTVILLFVGCGGEQQPSQLASTSQQADSLMELAFLAEDSGNFVGAQSYVRKALAIYEEHNDSANMSDCYTELAVCNQRTGDLTTSIESAQAAIRIDEARRDQQRLGSDYSNMAGIYLTSKQYDEARSFINKAIILDEANNRVEKLSVRYGLATEIYVKLGELDKALDFANKALKLDTSQGDTLKMGRRMSQKGDVYAAREEYAQAEKLYRDAIDMLQKKKERTSTCITYKQLGHLYMKTGRRQQARECLEQSLHMAEQQNNRYIMQTATEHLGNLLEQSEPATALRYLQQSLALKDSIYNEQTSQLLSSYAARFKSTEQAHTIEQQESQLRSHRFVIVGGVVILVLLLLLCGALYYMFRERTRSRNATRKLIEIRNTFFTNITHEFRTPLTLVHGLSHQMLTHPDMDEAQRQQCLTDIQRQGDSLLTLVNELLEASKLMGDQQTPPWMHGNVAAYVSMTVDAYRSYAATQQVALHYQPDTSDIEADFVGNYVAKILRNLISNSLKHLPQGGDIIISLQATERQWQLHVEDTGGGISDEDLEYIFVPFYRGSGSNEGNSTGIGLNFVQQMVEKMGGTVSVRNAQQGAHFTVELPRKSPHGTVHAWDGTKVEAPTPLPIAPRIDKEQGAMSKGQEKSTSHSSPLPSSGGIRGGASLLIVEDNQDIARFISTVMGPDFNTFFATDGEEALEKAQETMPDIILTDVMMPRMDGMELCRRVRQSDVLNHIPIIVISAKDDERDRLDALQAGADAYLLKPFNAEELTLRVDQLLRQRQLLRQKFASGLPASGDYTGLKEGERQFLERLTALIESQLSNRDLNTDMLADGMKMTRTQLNSKTRAVTGNTANNYIARIRMDRAARMLSQSDLNIGEVAMKCGFEDVSYFSRVFKQAFDCTPSQYRQGARGEK